MCAVVEVHVDLAATWRGSAGARLLDRAHAAIVERLVAILSTVGWTVLVEYGFNHFGERGSVDILAWHAATRALLIIEVKSQIVDFQALLSSVSRKVRLVPRLVASRGWSPTWIGQLVAVPDTRATRDAVRRHGATFAVALPSRTAEVRRWLRMPSGHLAGLMFLADALPRNTNHESAGVQRMRRPAPARRRAQKHVVSSSEGRGGRQILG